MKTLLTTLALVATLTMLNGCGGPKAFTKGEYDDPTRVELLDDKFNESDMQQMADTTIKAMAACGYIAKAEKPPIVIVERVQNRTQEHIDTVSMTDMIRTALIKTGKVRFVNKEERGTVDEEMDYQHQGEDEDDHAVKARKVKQSSAKRKGHQTGADYILSGALATNIQEVGDDKFIYYKLTMNLTSMETTTIDCTEEKQVRKKYKKRSIGL
ncbi:MAG: penicillin-binding protein activator LpoB [Deltaproteobacteria bacterium]|nr:penicillin-binding protein activator LpoB [Deltaproteobacteria bacterium]